MLFHVIALDGSAIIAPPCYDGRRLSARYPFSIMPVGSYFVIPLGHATAKARNAANSHKSRNPGWRYESWIAGEGNTRLRRTA